jgi:signal transduction histidine kinase
MFGFSLPKGFSQPERPPVTLEQLQGALSGFDLAEETKACLESGKSFSAPEVTYSTRIFNIFGAPIRLHHGEIIGCVILVSDITEQKVLDRSKDEFFSIASHELRTPLTSIKGNSSMILEYYSDEVKDKALKEMLTDIEESSTRLIEIVNDFLDMSSLEQGKIIFKKEAFSLEEIIEKLVYELKAGAEEKKLYLKYDKLTVDSLPKVLADKNRTKQVLYNLVGNAIKFTQEGGVTIDAQTENDFVKILVTDTGRGIPLDTQKILFHKFQQAGSSLLTRDTTRGTGLGLYISRMIIQRMGGEISLDKSEENHGSTFSFSLPVAKADSRPQAERRQTEMVDPQTGLTKPSSEHNGSGQSVSGIIGN